MSSANRQSVGDDQGRSGESGEETRAPFYRRLLRVMKRHSEQLLHAWRRDPKGRIPRAAFVSREEVLRQFPDVPPEGLTGGAVFWDGQIYSPPRLTLAFVRSAVEAGADAMNYAEVVGFLRAEGRIQGVEVEDLAGGQRFTIRSQVVLNATGPWGARLLGDTLRMDLGRERPTFSRDVGLVTRRKLSSNIGLACPTGTRDAEAVLDRGGRHLFLLPWRGHTLVGVWHQLSTDPPDDVEVGDEELSEFVADANTSYPGLRLSVDDVTMVNTGLILFGDESQEPTEHSFGKRSLLIDHARRHQLEGLVTLIGVRATMARGMAEKTVDLVLRKLARPNVRCQTEHTPIHGGAFQQFDQLVESIAATGTVDNRAVCTALAHNHGAAYRDVLAYGDEDPSLLHPIGGDSAVLGAEVVHAVRREMALTLSDVVLRRTDLGTACDPGDACLHECAAIMRRELDWDDERVQDEVQTLRTFYRRKGARRQFAPASRAAVS